MPPKKKKGNPNPRVRGPKAQVDKASLNTEMLNSNKQEKAER